MLKAKIISALALASVFLPSIRAQYADAVVASARPSIDENFSQNPALDGWRWFGDTNLFQWDAAGQNLRVTWDSSQSNSYFYHPLGAILTRTDDFKIGFDLLLSDIAGGANPKKPSSFPLAIGLQNFAEASGTNFLRGTGTNSPDLVEFTFFPDTGYGPTLWPSVWSTNSSLNYSGASDYTTEALPVGVPMRVTMSYSASNQTLVTAITTNGAAFGPINSIKLATNFTDFRVDSFAIESYSDAGQDPQYAGSLLAHGVVDNIEVIAPPPPAQNLAILSANGVWKIEFAGQTNWVYALQRTVDFRSWRDASASVAGTNGPMVLSDGNPPPDRAFYRIRAARP